MGQLVNPKLIYPFPFSIAVCSLVNVFTLSLCQIIKMASVEPSVFRRTESTSQLSVGNIMRRWTSMNHRKVGLYIAS